MQYKYKRVKTNSKYAKALQNKGYKVINTDAHNGYITFEIKINERQVKLYD